MGNTAIIKPENGTQGVYLHWNGGRDSVEPFLEYCKLKGYRGLDQDTSYGLSRLAQVVGNFFGGSTSLGVVDKLSNTDKAAGCLDNGIYLVSGWDIVGRIPEYAREQREYNRLEMLIAIDEAQPMKEQLKSYLGATEIPTKDLKVGDMVYHMDFTGEIKQHKVVGFGDDKTYVNGSIRNGIPYIDKYGCSSNPNNYLEEETVRVCKLTDEYKRIKCENIKEMFSDKPDKGSILLYIPERKEFFGITFGCGDNLEPGFDGYLYLTQHTFEDTCFDECDGGQIDYMNEDTNYKNICDTIFDALDFTYGNECIEFEVIQ